MYKNFFLFGISYTIAIMSPGPSLAVITKNTLSSPRRGMVTAVGTVMGIAVQSLYVLIGLDFIHQNPNTLKYMNLLLGLYLLYLGGKDLFSHQKIENAILVENQQYKNQAVTKDSKQVLWRCFKEGFLTDAFNPLALTFFLAIFSTYVLEKTENLYYQWIYWGEVIIIGAFWFIGVSILMSQKQIKNLLAGKASRFISLAMNVILCYLGGILIFKTLKQFGGF